MLNALPSEWPRFAERDRQRQHLDKEGKDISYEALVAGAPASLAEHLQPERMQKVHAEAQECIARLTRDIKEARLDSLIVIGDDQKEIFLEDNLPAMLVYRGPTIRNVPRHKARGGDPWYVAAAAKYYENEPREFPVDSALADHVIGHLTDNDFDVSVSEKMGPGVGEGHAFGWVHKRLMTDFEIPVLPVFLNTYYPPNQPTPARCWRLGQQLRAAVESFPGDARVGVVASGGLSHFTVDEDLDGSIAEALRRNDGAALSALPRRKLNAGSSEIRNWICMAGAAEKLRNDWLLYRPGYRTPAGTGTGLCFAAWK
jgi:3-O-methylgallate 3,4-dioxygenase